MDPRLIALGFCVVAAIASGTPYLYGVYSPQLIARCQITAEAAATISFASNLGSGLGGLPAGVVIDRFGVRVSLLAGSMCLLIGYGSLYLCYQAAVSSIVLLSISIMFVGFGSIISYFSTLKVSTTSFPHHRGTAGACAVSGYGLSALVFSAISAYWFENNTSGLLKFLALSCGLSIAVSSFFIKLYNQDEINQIEHAESGLNSDPTTETVTTDTTPTLTRSQPKDIKQNGLGTFLNAHRGSLVQINFNESSSSLFSYASSIMSRSSSSISSLVGSSPTKNAPIQFRSNSNSINNINSTYYNSSPTSSRLSNSPNNAISSSPIERPPFRSNSSSKMNTNYSPRNSFSTADYKSSNKMDIENLPNVIDEETPLITKKSKPKKHHSSAQHVKNLLTSKSFLVHYIMLGFISAVGQLYIYSVGFIVKALFDSSFPIGDTVRYLLSKPALTQSINGLSTIMDQEPTAEAYQALQVSLLAFGSFMGRLAWGPLSDLASKKFKYQRLWLVILSSMLLITGQVLALSINDVTKLSFVSLCIGLGYGSIFSVYPAIVAEEFGSKGSTTSWGLICTGSLAGNYFLNKILGQNIDRMSEFIDGEYVCLVGKRCYADIFKINIMLCASSILLMSGSIFHKSRRNSLDS